MKKNVAVEVSNDVSVLTPACAPSLQAHRTGLAGAPPSTEIFLSFLSAKNPTLLTVRRKERITRTVGAWQESGLSADPGAAWQVAACRRGRASGRTIRVPSGEIAVVTATPATALGPRSTLRRISGFSSAGRVARHQPPHPRLLQQPPRPPPQYCSTYRAATVMEREVFSAGPSSITVGAQQRLRIPDIPQPSSSGPSPGTAQATPALGAALYRNPVLS